MTRRIRLSFTTDTSTVEYSLAFFYKKVLQSLKKYVLMFPCVQTCLKPFFSNGFTIKTLHIRLPAPAIWHDVQQNYVQLRFTIFFTSLCYREVRQIIISINHTSRSASYFSFPRLPRSAAHHALLI